jgi:hypothetical protein
LGKQLLKKNKNTTLIIALGNPLQSSNNSISNNFVPQASVSAIGIDAAVYFRVFEC